MANYASDIPKQFITTSGMKSVVDAIFGEKNEALHMMVYNFDETLLETVRILLYELLNDDSKKTWLRTKIHTDLRDAGFYNGHFNIEYLLFKNVVGGADNLYIHEISNSRKEIRIAPIGQLAKKQMTIFSKPTNKRIFPDNSSDGYYLSPYADFGANGRHMIINWQVDNITFPIAPYSIILKFIEPLPEAINEKDYLSIFVPLSEYLKDKVLLIPAGQAIDVNLLRPSNFNIKSVQQKAYMNYKNWNDLVGEEVDISSKIIDKYFGSGSSVVDLNVDYKKFDNYIFYSSAEKRIRNFKYKLELIESYDTSISNLQSVITGSATGSSEYINNINKYTQRKNTILSNFDHYERYLYYESASYITSSYGSFYPTTWPKSSSTKPYVLYATTATESVAWFNGVIDSASFYDLNNNNALISTIPLWIREDEYSDNYEVFVQMIGQQMDTIYQYTKQLSNISNRDESLYEGLSKDLVYHVLRSYGWDGENDNQFDDLWYYTLGTDEQGEYILTGSLAISQSLEWITAVSQSISTEDSAKEIWKRVLNNLPYLNKTKGTKEGIRSLINCYGIPSTELHIREYGGPELLSNKSYYEHRKFTYALNMSPTNQLTVPKPSEFGTVEFRFKTLENGPQIIWQDNSGSADVIAVGITADNSMSIDSANEDIVLDTIPVNDGDWWTFGLAWDVGNSYNVWLKKSTYGQLSHEYTASIDLGAPYGGPGDYLYYIGSGSDGAFSGSIQEFRYYNTALTEDIFDDHVLAPTTYCGITSTASIDELWYRLPLGTDTTTYNHSSVTVLDSQHPNYVIPQSASFAGFPNEINYDPVEETYVQAWPDISSNRVISNKVRIEDNEVTGSLYLENRVEESAFDMYPLDNPKIGVYFSPTNEVNQDIAEYMGSVRIDNWIGAWDNYYLDYYDELTEIRAKYFRHHSGRYGVRDYFRLVEYFNQAVFKHVKEILPAKSRAITGLVVEPHLLNRSKFTISRNKPEVVDETKEIGITLIDDSLLTGSLHNHYVELNVVVTGSSEYVWNEVIFPSVPVGSLSGSTVLNDSTLREAVQPNLTEHWTDYFEVFQFVDSESLNGHMEVYLSASDIYHDTLPRSIRNHRYDGCRMESSDFNVDSPDTIDNGPVVEFHESAELVLYNQVPNRTTGNLGVR